MKRRRAVVVLFALLLGLGSAGFIVGAQDASFKYGGHTYVHVMGKYTQSTAFKLAKDRGGYPVVFNSEAEVLSIAKAFNFAKNAPMWTGHYQTPTGREPGAGWVTVSGGGASGPLSKIFNSDGPDDGVKNKWGWQSTDNGVEIFYGPSQGKNEDAAVIWHDAYGRLEDVSINHIGGVVIEFNR